jgi:hypothetical protein
MRWFQAGQTLRRTMDNVTFLKSVKLFLDDPLAAMDKIRWTPATGSKTTLEMIRKDRDR